MVSNDSEVLRSTILTIATCSENNCAFGYFDVGPHDDFPIT